MACNQARRILENQKTTAAAPSRADKQIVPLSQPKKPREKKTVKETVKAPAIVKRIAPPKPSGELALETLIGVLEVGGGETAYIKHGDVVKLTATAKNLLQASKKKLTIYVPQGLNVISFTGVKKHGGLPSYVSLTAKPKRSRHDDESVSSFGRIEYELTEDVDSFTAEVLVEADKYLFRRFGGNENALTIKLLKDAFAVLDAEAEGAEKRVSRQIPISVYIKGANEIELTDDANVQPSISECCVHVIAVDAWLGHTGEDVINVRNPLDPLADEIVSATVGDTFDLLVDIANDSDKALPPRSVKVFVPVPQKYINMGAYFQTGGTGFTMKLAEPVRMPDGYSVSYTTDTITSQKHLQASLWHDAAAALGTLDLSKVTMACIENTSAVAAGSQATIPFKLSLPYNADGDERGLLNVFGPSFIVNSCGIGTIHAGNSVAVSYKTCEINGVVWKKRDIDAAPIYHKDDIPVAGAQVLLRMPKDLTYKPGAESGISVEHTEEASFAVTKTNADGAYAFHGLPYGSVYDVIFKNPDPDNLKFLPQLAGRGSEIDSDADANGVAVGIDPCDRLTAPFVAAGLEPIAYSVRFNGNGADTEAAPNKMLVVRPNRNITDMPADPERLYYRFTGWYTEPEEGKRFDRRTRIDEDTEVFAHWSRRRATVRFNKDGMRHGRVPPAITTECGERVALPGNCGELKRLGYDFFGWSRESGGEPVSDEFLVREDTTLYPAWIPTRYEFSLDLNGVGGACEKPPYVSIGDTLNLSDYVKEFDSENFELLGFSTCPRCNGSRQSGVSTVLNIDAAFIRKAFADSDMNSATLFAVTKRIRFTAQFNANGGAFEDGEQTKNISAALGSAFLDEVAAPTLEGHNFDGWYTKPDGGEMFNLNIKADRDFEMFAKFSPRAVRVSFDLSSADNSAAGERRLSPMQDYVYGDVLVMSNIGSTPKRTGYTFAGWSLDPNGEPLESLVLTGGTVLYPVWEKNKYVIRFNPNGGCGTVRARNKLAIESECPLDAAMKYFNRAGFSLAGFSAEPWNAEPEFTDKIRLCDRHIQRIFRNDTLTSSTVYAVWKKAQV
ncbi:MAG: InlB B-repeat-containing protein [Oscillospiraceae bacterium]|jgi:hypothetical protein|nr:InlB B-repeat-containing protein [Oscillospiraceae bacterium]